MGDGGVGGQRFGYRGRVDWRGLGDGQLDDLAAGLRGEADHAVGVGAGGGDQDLAAGRQEGADRGLGDEVAAALQGEGDVRVGLAAGDLQQAGADAEVQRAEVVVPGGEVLREGRAYFGPRCHRPRD